MEIVPLRPEQVMALKALQTIAKLLLGQTGTLSQ